MTQERIDEIADTTFSNVENHPELLHKIKLDGEDVSIYDLMKSSYIAGLKRNLDEEIKEQVKEADYVYLFTDPDREGSVIA